MSQKYTTLLFCWSLKLNLIFWRGKGREGKGKEGKLGSFWIFCVSQIRFHKFLCDSTWKICMQLYSHTSTESPSVCLDLGGWKRKRVKALGTLQSCSAHLCCFLLNVCAVHVLTVLWFTNKAASEMSLLGNPLLSSQKGLLIYWHLDRTVENILLFFFLPIVHKCIHLPQKTCSWVGGVETKCSSPSNWGAWVQDDHSTVLSAAPSMRDRTTTGSAAARLLSSKDLHPIHPTHTSGLALS